MIVGFSAVCGKDARLPIKYNTGQSRNKMRLRPVLYLFMSNSWNKSALVLVPELPLPRPDPC